MSQETSRDVSRENSSTDLLGSIPKERKKNVHFNRAQDDSGLEVKVKHISDTGSAPEMEELDLAASSGRSTASRRSMSASKSRNDRPGPLFFLEEDEDDANDVAVTPFKKTGKIKTSSSKVQVSPALRAQVNSNGLNLPNLTNPFTLDDFPSTEGTRIADRRNTHIDIPMIRLPSNPIDDDTTNTTKSSPIRTPGSQSRTLSTPGAETPGTPAEGMVGMFSNASRQSVHSAGSQESEMHARLMDNTTRNAQRDETSEQESDENRKMNLEAYKLVRAHTVQTENMKRKPGVAASFGNDSRRNSMTSTLGSESIFGVPDQFEVPDDLHKKKHSSRGGVLSNLMQLYNSTVYQQQQPTTARGQNPGSSSGTSTPKWHQRNSQSNASINALLGASQSLAGLGVSSRNSSAISLVDMEKSQRPSLGKTRQHSGGVLSAVRQSFHRPSRLDAELRITLAIADVLQRQRFILKLCKVFLLYGAPSHRLEDYLKLTAMALEIDAQFLYLPGCMIVAFDDKATHTSDVKIVRVVQGIDLGKLNEVHTIYKNVLHAVIPVEQGIVELDQQLEMPQLYRLGFVLMAYGLASVCVGPFAFDASFIDLPLQFLLGLIVGVLQLVVAPRSSLYANVFEILATIVVSFLGRAFGSIRHGDGFLFCFAAATQSSIALILPGYMVLCGALELQSKSMVAGSVRLFYAIVYSLFLSFGITIGSVLYGWMDSGATTATTCTSDISPWFRFLFVPGFALCLLIVNQARPRQAPIAIFIAGAGYATNYFTNLRFGSAQVSNAISAFVIGCLGNLYSRIGHGLAFTSVTPAIFVLVPSGIASGSSLVSGLDLANSILNNTANATYSGTTLGVSSAGALTFGYSMLQIAIGITVGLFASALVIYIPLWGSAKKTGILTF